MKTKLRIDPYPTILRALEEGVAYGWMRAHKHVESPSQEEAVEAIVQAILVAFEEHGIGWGSGR